MNIISGLWTIVLDPLAITWLQFIIVFLYKNDIFRLFESKKIMKICSKTHQIAPFKKKISGKHAPEPP